MIDALLDAWQAAPGSAMPETRVVGHRWSAPSFAARDFLARNLVPYRWLPADEPEGQRLLAAAGVTEADLPLGFPDGVSGGQLTERARRQALRFGAELLSAREVVGLSVAGATRMVHFSDGRTIAAHTAVLATGVAYRRLSAPGLGGLTNRGVYYGTAATEAPACSGQDVYIVGGANSAGQAAVHFARYARRVNLLIRGGDLRSSMSKYLIDQIAANEVITVHPYTEVADGDGVEHLDRLTLRDARTGETRLAECSWLFVFIGAEPRTEWLGTEIARDARGYVLTGPDLLTEGRRPAGWIPARDPYHLETSLPGVFAAGDVRAESVKRVASAVGEGAMAVSLVHRYLESS